MVVLNVVDIKATEYRVWREIEGAVTRVYASVGYTVTTAEGRDFDRSRTVELTGTAKTRAATLLNDIIALAKTTEGL